MLMDPVRGESRLRVFKWKFKELDVVVDGNVVGKTPWEGPLSPGDHTVLLRGPDNFGTQPVSVPVRLKETTPLGLFPEVLNVALRIEAKPAGASIAIDGVTVGRGIWEGRLRTGHHRIEVTADGFAAAAREVTFEDGGNENLVVALIRDLSSPRWQKPARFTLELDAAPTFTLSFGGDVAVQCSEECSRGVGAGGFGVVYAGYELGNGFGFGASAGYLLMQQTTTARSAMIQIRDPSPEKIGNADDVLVLGGLLVGAWAGLSLGDRYQLQLRLGAGALLSAISDLRGGTFTKDGIQYRLDPTLTSDAANFFTMMPEVRAGLRLSDHVDLLAGLTAVVLVRLNKPVWSNPIEGIYGRSSNTKGYFARFNEDVLVGKALTVLSPGLGVRYMF